MTSSCLKGEKSARSHDHERCSPRGYQLSHDLVNWLNRFDPDEFLIEAAKEVTELVRIEAQRESSRLVAIRPHLSQLARRRCLPARENSDH
jgi:hypothetical protein